MPVCPNCSYEYIDGVTYCPDCQTALVDEEQLKYNLLSEDDWIVIYTSGEEYEVQMMRDNLLSAGLAATILSQKDHNFPAPGDFSIVKLLVKKDDMQSALSFIDKIKSSDPDKENE